MAINLLIPIGVALGGYGVYRWWKGSHAAYVTPPPAKVPGLVAPASSRPAPAPAAQPSGVDPGFVPGPDPLAPPGGYTPGGYNPYIPDQPVYPSPADDYNPPAAPGSLGPPAQQVEPGGGGGGVPLADLDPQNWNPLDPMFWDSSSSVSGFGSVHTRDSYGVGGNDRAFRALQARRLRRRGGL